MLRKILVFIIGLMLSVGVYAQSETNPRVDSLAKISNNTALHDTVRLEAMFNLSAALLFIDGDSCKRVIKQQMELATKQEDPKWLATAYFKKSDYFYTVTGQRDSSLVYAHKSLGIAETIDHGRLICVMTNLIGSIYRDNDQDSALYYYEASIEAGKEIKDYKLLSGRFVNIGFIHQDKGDYLQAIQSLQTALRLFDRYPNDGWRSNACNGLGNIYLDIKDYDKAERYYLEARELAIGLEDPIGEVISNLNIVTVCKDRNAPGDVEKADSCFNRVKAINEAENNIYITQYFTQVWADYLQSIGRPEESKVFALESLELTRIIKNTNAEAFVNVILGFVENDLENYSSAVKHCKEAYSLSSETEEMVTLAGSCDCLYRAYSELGNTHEALNYHVLSTAYEDSIMDLENARQLAESELEYAYQQKQFSDSLEVVKANKEIELEHLQTLEGEKRSKIVLFSVVGVLIIVLFFIFREIQRKKKQTLVLNEKNTLIADSLSEKELLLKEMHHRVKNNFQTISSLLDLQSKEIDDVKTLETINDGKERIRAMALIHQKLYQDDKISTLDFQDYTEKLTSQIVNTYSLGKVETEVDAANCELDVDTAIPLGLILNELITNACKYAFGEGTGKLSIKIFPVSKGNYSLVVKDSGRGFIKEFDPSKVKSLGLRLVKRLSRQLQGSFNYRYDNGSIFEVTFKDTELRKSID